MDRVAAAVALCSGSGDDLQIYLVHRSPELRFFGDYLAMPGGVRGREDGPDDPDGGDHTALRRCAVREVFEETGVALDAGLRTLPADHRATLRRTLVDGGREAAEAAAAQLFAACTEHGSGLRELCRVRTPPFAPVRYDTVFFLAQLPAGEEPGIWPGELVGGRWQAAEEFLAEWTAGACLIVPPVLILLEALRRGDLDTFAAEAAAIADSYRAGKLHRVRFSPGVLMASLTTPTLPPATTTNCYIVGTDRLYVIDPGAPEPEDQAPLFDLLDELVAEGAALDSVVCTHHHPDHVGAVRAVSERYGLPVCAHPITLERLDTGAAATRAIDDGDRIPLGTAPDGTPGWELEALFTPGHDRGHLAFRESRYGALIAGDMLSTVATIMIDPPEGHLRTYMASLERLRETPMTTLYPAHGPAVPDGRKLVEQFIKHRRHRHTLLEQTLHKGPQTVEELLPVVYWDIKEELYPYARRSMTAGLEMLQEDGRATRDGETWRPVNGRP